MKQSRLRVCLFFISFLWQGANLDMSRICLLWLHVRAYVADAVDIQSFHKKFCTLELFLCTTYYNLDFLYQYKTDTTWRKYLGILLLICTMGLIKDQIILALVWGILADFWIPHEIDSWNFQHMLDWWFSEASQNLSSFRQLLFSLFHGETKGKNSKSLPRPSIVFWVV